MMPFYNVCPKCGAHLDPGEKCECETAGWQQEEFFEQHTVSSGRGQAMFFMDRKNVITK